MENSGSLNGWTKQETLKLIEEYKKYSILYKPDHPDHLRTNKKKEAFMAIVDALRLLKPTVTENSIKTKLKTLRHQLASEKKKIKANEDGDASQYKPTLWCYDELSFLMNVNDEQHPSTTTTSSSRFNNMRIFHESQFEEQTTEDSEHFMRPTKLRYDSEMDAFQMTINKSMDIIDKITSPKVTSKEEAFCQYLSTELRSLKFEESFDEFKMSAMILLQNVKAKEKKIISGNNYVWRERDCSSPSQAATAAAAASASASASIQIPVQCTASNASSSGSVRCPRKRIRTSSSVESILDENISNDFGDEDFPKRNFKCEPEVDF